MTETKQKMTSNDLSSGFSMQICFLICSSSGYSPTYRSSSFFRHTEKAQFWETSKGTFFCLQNIQKRIPFKRKRSFARFTEFKKKSISLFCQTKAFNGSTKTKGTLFFWILFQRLTTWTKGIMRTQKKTMKYKNLPLESYSLVDLTNLSDFFNKNFKLSGYASN